ncbi:iron-containing alcohol dehydrogenase [Propionicicella superfundia]|uniref:iron-containing alcohol dehydrogenase n=1 Tax=Propionicicella superfundia TaxID=348582 RepID=UPI00042578DD|nr:iron-containing alcohol dehydrogenase [Propionicicella superfundia]
MTTFDFATTGRILFGPGRSAELPSIVAGMGERPFVVTGSDPTRYAAILGDLQAGFRVAGEPTVEVVRDALAAARAQDADLVVAIGGGSVIDTSKAVAALLGNGGDPLDYAEVIGAGRTLTRPSVPLVAVPTTSGTGSEATANAVVGSVEHGVKVSLRSVHMLPDVALVDPELVVDCPPHVTASAGLDALTQCIEPLVSHLATPLTDALCREGLRRAGRGLRRAYADGADLAARTDMAICSLVSGMSLANAKLGAVHGLAGPLGGMIWAPHGSICAALLPAVCRVNIAALKSRDAGNAALARYAEVGELLTGTADADAGIAWIAETVRMLGIGGLGSLGLTEDRIDEACEKGAAASSMKGNPLVLTHEELREIIVSSW